MSFEQFEYKRGILGQGCYIAGYATRPGLLRCRLPALLVMSLMDLGRWQLLSVSEQFYQDASMQPQSWRIQQLHEHIRHERQRIAGVNSNLDNAVALDSHSDTVTGEADCKTQNSEGLLPLNSLADFYWRPDSDAIENAIVRLQNYPGDQLKKRFARILEQLPEFADNH